MEVTRAKVRRERMGHIELSAPVAHIWFSKGVPSRLGLLLDLSPRNLERVLYFAQYIITSVDEDAREGAREELEQTHRETVALLEQRREALQLQAAAVAEQEAAEAEQTASEEGEADAEQPAAEGEAAVEQPASEEAPDVEQPVSEEPSEGQKIAAAIEKVEEDIALMEEEYQAGLDELDELRPSRLLVEARFRELQDHYPMVFRASMGAEAVLELLRELDLEAEREKLMAELQSTSGQRRKKAVKRLRVVEAFRKSANMPEWMVLTALPVLPPDLRPMVQLDGGRFATSDLNDLYRRVINRNNRLRRLLELEAPEIIIRNEKRMLQEAVDALIDNGRRGRAIAGSHNHKLKSLSDLLRGKQGRFRQNLLGKRVDYSGRSVIVVGPELRMDQCGLPKRMALELFKPFVMHRLVVRGLAHNIKSAKRMVERVRPEVWDVLEEVIKDRPVFLNRAPTLHRLGIQAFKPVLIEGSAIQVHPLVCTAFNADFDGDQMAVHVPLSQGALQESGRIMLSAYNMLSPASGEPMVAPTLDMVLGCYYLTLENPQARGAGKRFSSPDEAVLAFDAGVMDIQASIEVFRVNGAEDWSRTTFGRLLFRDVLPEELAKDPANWNGLMEKGALKDLVSRSYVQLGHAPTSIMLDKIKQVGFHYATVSGITIAINDLQVSEQKGEVLTKAEDQIQQLEEQYQRGLISERERHEQVVSVWEQASDSITRVIEESLDTFGGIYMMANSGAKGNISQIKQMAGMRGLMSDPKGRLIEVPVTSSFREGLSVLEYFISTHGARKGLADTALRTADSGYLTRRMIDVAQDIICMSHECDTTEGTWIRHEDEKERNNYIAAFSERLVGRVTAAPIADPSTGEVLLDANSVIDSDLARELWEKGVREAYVRSPLTCEARRGICRLCYGTMPATGRLIAPGEAAGIIAAQSIGEPGTQLTMRTFHTGGVAGVDITSGIPRVEELFEARVPKNHAILAEIDGTLEVEENPDGKRLRVVSVEEYREGVRCAVGLQAGRQGRGRGGAGRAAGPPQGPQEERRCFVERGGPGGRQGGRVQGEGRGGVGGAGRAHLPRAPNGLRGGQERVAGHRGAGAHGGAQEPPRHPAHPGEGGPAAVHHRGDPEGVPLPGRDHQRQAHRDDHPPDAAQGAGGPPRRHRAAAGRAGGPLRLRGDQQEGAGGGRRARPGDTRPAGHHQGLPEHRQLPGRRLLPGDDQGAHRSRRQRHGGPPPGPQGERHHRPAHPRSQRDHRGGAASADGGSGVPGEPAQGHGGGRGAEGGHVLLLRPAGGRVG